jgi:hypothetical protein
LVLVVGGFAIRMLDLTDPPLDFHPSRQLFSYTIARGLYYQMSPGDDPELRQRAIAAGKATDLYEPRIQETAVALLYLLAGGERVYLARVLTSLLWLAGGALLFRLASQIASPMGALFGLGYYLFLPFAIQASRSFQPDVLMVVGIIATAYCLYGWRRDPSWLWSLIVGLIGGLTVLVKAQGIFAVASMAGLTVLTAEGFARALKSPKVWAMAGIMVVIPAVFYLGPWHPGGGGYFGYFTLAGSRLWQDPGSFVRWANFLHDFADMGIVVLAVAATLLVNERGRPVMLGLWIGYGLLGISFPWQITTHNYYSLSLVPAVALGVAVVGAWLVEAVRGQGLTVKLAFILVCVFAIAYPAWIARSSLLGKDYRSEPGAWRKMGEELPRSGKIIALTHDYGWRLQYWGYTPVSLWPYNADYELQEAFGGNRGADFQSYFENLTDGFDYFLVTLYGELEAQPQLQQTLQEGFPVAQRGDGYILYDLREP